MIKKILLASLLSAAVLIPVAAQRNSDSFAEEVSDECAFPDLELPDEFVVYAAGGSNGRPLDFQLEQKSGDMAGQTDLIVNSPSKSVVLMLGVNGPNIWNIQWTKDTEIVAVLASGYYRQAVAGLPEETPVLTSTYFNGAKCGYFYIGLNGEPIESLNLLSQKLFGQPIEKIEEMNYATNWIGKPLEEEPSLFSSNDTTVNSFYDPNAPLAGFAGVQAALEKGILRRATEEDLKAWMNLQQKLHPEKDVSAPSVGEESQDTYVVLDNFTYPGGLTVNNTTFNSPTFFIPEDVPDPSGDHFGATVYNFKTGKCSGVLCSK